MVQCNEKLHQDTLLGQARKKGNLKKLLYSIQKLFHLAHVNYYTLNEIVQNKSTIKKLAFTPIREDKKKSFSTWRNV